MPIKIAVLVIFSERKEILIKGAKLKMGVSVKGRSDGGGKWMDEEILNEDSES